MKLIMQFKTENKKHEKIISTKHQKVSKHVINQSVPFRDKDYDFDSG
jgi:hypothetical protein